MKKVLNAVLRNAAAFHNAAAFRSVAVSRGAVAAFFGVFLMLLPLAGCGSSLEADSSIVYVNKKGGVTSLDVETLDQGYYDEEELREFVQEAVDGYAAENGKDAVTLKSITVKDGIAKMELEYGSAADYSAFNGIEMYQGKVVTSLADGYVYDGDFAAVEDGAVTGAATKQEIYEEGDLKVVIIRANIDVKVQGEIRFVSCENVKLTGKDTVSIRKGYYLDSGSGSAAGTSGTSGTSSTSDTSGAAGASGVLSVEDTELGGTGEADASGEGASDDEGAVETDVYTFIVYK